MAIDPVCLFKYLLLKTIYDISDVDVVERSLVDMSFKYFLDMAPEDEVINPSTLTKFRRLRLKDMDLLNLLINRTVTLAMEQGIIKSTSIIVDSTHSHSRSNPHSPTDHFKQKYKERYKIEAKNAELKHVYGYDRAISYGLSAMQMQGALAIFAANMKRIIKLI
jgi:hypothetical protein